MRNRTPLRYPGGKAKILDFMKEFIKLNFNDRPVYVEPYAGGAAVALGLLMDGYVEKVCINDNDIGIYSFWKSILEYSDEFLSLLNDTSVDINTWKIQKQVYTNYAKYSTLEIGFATFFLNRCNYSGIINGGPIGGISQNGFWKIDARFNKNKLTEKILEILKYKDSIELYNCDTLVLLKRYKKKFEKCLLYLDPPYFNKGSKLYKNHYQEKDHIQIADIVKKLNGHWIVSYDNTPEIVDLYKFTKNTIEFNIPYSARKNRKGREVMFISDKSIIPVCPVC